MKRRIIYISSTFSSFFSANYRPNKKDMKKLKIERIPWTQKQKEVITNFFKTHIKNKRAPRKQEVEELINRHKTLFKEKNWVKIKAFVYNCYK